MKKAFLIIAFAFLFMGICQLQDGLLQNSLLYITGIVFGAISAFVTNDNKRYFHER